jgi:hypothetical protein
LSVLKDAGLVSTRRNGVFIYYQLEKDALRQLDEWLSPFLPKVKTIPREKVNPTPKLPKENPFDKFQSEF